MADNTVMRSKMEGKMYRLANLGYALGYAIQVAEGKGYYTIGMLGWVNEKDAKAEFKKFLGEEE